MTSLLSTNEPQRESPRASRQAASGLIRPARLALWLAGLLVIGWAFAATSFRDEEGFLDGTVSLPLSAGGALIFVGWGVGTRFFKFSGWLALALVGQTIALQLMDAGNRIHYQHYYTLAEVVGGEKSYLLVLLLIQTLIVAAALWSGRRETGKWLYCRLKVWQIVGIGLVLVLTSACVSREVSRYVEELCVATFVLAVNLGNLLLVAKSFPADTLPKVREIWLKWFDTSPTPIEKTKTAIDPIPIVGAIWTISVAALLCWLSYERHPHIADEVVYLYHAKYLAAGQLTMTAPPVQEAFDVDLMYYNGDHWYCPVPPGWPACLAVGVLFGAPWLVNPILAGLNVVLSYCVVRKLYHRGTARLAVLLCCLSPWFIFMGMNFMTHTFTLTCALTATIGIVKARETGRLAWASLAGAAIGLVSLIRPLEGCIVAGLLGLWSLGVGGKRLRMSNLAALGAATLMIGSVGLWYNWSLTGNPLKFPIMLYTDKYYGPGSNALGFGPNIGLGWPLDPYPGHGLADAIVNANLNIASINTELFGWSIGSLVLCTLFLLAGNKSGSDYLMLTAITAIIGVHTFYWYSGGPDFGARYWYLAILPLVVLTARGIEWLTSQTLPTSSIESQNSTRAAVAIGALCLVALVSYFPWRAIDKYHHYLDMRADIRSLAQEHDFANSLVLIRGRRHPDYASAAAYNPIDLTSDIPVYAWDKNKEVRKSVVQVYGDRKIWIVNGPSLTGAGYEIVAGPAAAAEILANYGD